MTVLKYSRSFFSLRLLIIFFFDSQEKKPQLVFHIIITIFHVLQFDNCEERQTYLLHYQYFQIIYRVMR